jgi:hypothetical protein
MCDTCGLLCALCVGLGFLVRLRFALRILALWRVCAIAPSVVSGWRAFSSVSLCKSICVGTGMQAALLKALKGAVLGKAGPEAEFASSEGWHWLLALFGSLYSSGVPAVDGSIWSFSVAVLYTWCHEGMCASSYPGLWFDAAAPVPVDVAAGHALKGIRQC